MPEEKEAAKELGPLGHQILIHWKKYRPKMTDRLKREGRLEAEAIEAEDQTLDAAHLLIKQTPGLDWVQAMQQVREQFAFLPAEESFLGANEK
jgi:hypothetical protein